MAELSAILFYADFLSLSETSIPVTDTCKYFYVHETPMNICFLCDVEPFYNPDNPYFLQSKTEYELIKSKFGEDGAASFVNIICDLKACGMVNGERMLKVIHKFSSRRKYEKAMSIYTKWKKNLTYNNYTKNDDGEPIKTKCNRIIAHIDKANGLPVESSVLENTTTNGNGVETPISNIK